MKVLAINGSYRKRGDTTHLVEAVLEGCRTAGAETDHLLLLEKEIRTCLGCKRCAWEKGDDPGECVHEDDMDTIRRSLREADAFVAASPVYWGNMSSLMVNFMHRLTPFVYDKHLDGGMKGVPVFRRKAVKPGMIVTSMTAPFPFNRMSEFRHVYRLLDNVLGIAGYKPEQRLIVPGADLEPPIPDRAKALLRARRLGAALVNRRSP